MRYIVVVKYACRREEEGGIVVEDLKRIRREVEGREEFLRLFEEATSSEWFHSIYVGAVLEEPRLEWDHVR